MQAVEQLQSYFENEIKPGLRDLEKWRKNALVRAIISDVIFISLALYLVIHFGIKYITWATDSKTTFDSFAAASVFLGGFIVMLYYGYRFIWTIVKYSNNHWDKKLEFKKAVIGKIVNFLSPELNYMPERKIVSGREFLGSEIFPHSIYYPTGYIAEDFVDGKIGEINISFYEINGKDMVFPKSPAGTKIYDGRVERINFSGLFFTSDFNKSFNGHTLVLPETKINRPQWMQKSGRVPVKMDDPEFENIFTVYGTDQITARYLLSTSLMKRITGYYKKIGSKIYISFSYNKLHLAISHKADMFEMNLYKSIYDFDQVKGFYHDLKIALDIVEDLNLNTQVWLKDDQKNPDLYLEPFDYNYRKRWLYLLLGYTFGYLGLHYFYIGFRGKGLKNLLITLAVYPFLIYKTFIGHSINAGIVLTLSAFIWFVWINVTASWLEDDSNGFPLD